VPRSKTEVKKEDALLKKEAKPRKPRAPRKKKEEQLPSESKIAPATEVKKEAVKPKEELIAEVNIGTIGHVAHG
jgi:hypothetical protein